ncbi:Ger(x)C family spore germination protein [Bacillus sp. 7884-1]|uniref:Ger(x)C family spore germination protein n=1 Tax=Bacillus sp. 7884-1 TaxID=2021693 RepID=UPI000BA66AA0|nr:Ger(x)C family spore germination protein [Bacillus sp. 7884-1]PAE38612.1 spore gernimation protein GerC [Bacillus sp. 7884-1]
MKKATIGILLLLLLTGCWDRLPLKQLHLVNFTGLDWDEESGDVVLNYVVTKLKSPGHGSGKPNSQMSELRGPSLVEAVGKGEYTDQGPFLSISTGGYIFSKSFASHDPINELAFLLQAPYTAINVPIYIFDGHISKLLKTSEDPKVDFSDKLFDFITNLEKNSIAPKISMMELILSREEPLGDFALPMLKQFDSKIDLSGAILLRQGKNTGEELSTEQVRMLMLMLGKDKGRQYYTGDFQENGEEKHIQYGFTVKKGDSKIIVQPESSGLPKVKIRVKLKINAIRLKSSIGNLKPDYINRMEKELSNHLEEKSLETIAILQKANCDVLGVGKQLKAYNPTIWKSLNWRKDYPQLSIEPNFDIQILNADPE